MRKHSEQAGDRRRDGSCPFAPGFGEVPPYLAGRLLQQQASLACLDSMRREDQFERCLVMWGPRGNGKTTMLTWIESEARARGIQAISVAAADIETPASLAARISGPPRWRDRLGEVSWKGVSWKAGSLDPAPPRSTSRTAAPQGSASPADRRGPHARFGCGPDGPVRSSAVGRPRRTGPAGACWNPWAAVPFARDASDILGTQPDPALRPP